MLDLDATPRTAEVRFDPLLTAFIEDEVLPGLAVDRDRFWAGFRSIVRRLAPVNAALLAERDRLQRLIEARQAGQAGDAAAPEEEAEFLRAIGYLVASPPPFQIETRNVDAEIATICAPQLVVPIDNSRYAINAVNARWGSLYDALYGSDVIPGSASGPAYDPARGDQVVAWTRAFLDDAFALESGSHREVTGYRVRDGRLSTNKGGLKGPASLAGYRGAPEAPEALILRHHGLHVELQVRRADPVGARSPAGLADVLLESAATAIMDFEDSVAAVDASDKIAVYRNWLGLMKGSLQTAFRKDGREVHRRLAEDRTFTGPDGLVVGLSGRALMLARNVGLLMTTSLAFLDDADAPEGIVDAVLTALIGLHDIQGARRNSRLGSIYVVKPKLHGPDEAAFTGRLFDEVEDLLGLPRDTIKVGVMDEERRTSLNLRAVLAPLRRRVAFINTGFLDRTGDEIHTAMALGPVLRKAQMKAAPWLGAYEDNNVDIGLACGFAGRAQIGKGMWAMPDEMAQMMAQKIAHPRSGATTAWVPSPTAATLHAVHYHQVDVAGRQQTLVGRRTDLDELLRPPLADASSWTPSDIAAEVDANAQAILGYVVRWVDQGIGCSKVPDVHGVGLMEDRATCRISSQILANWLAHGVIDAEAVQAALTRMARLVDAQNADTPGYRPMGETPGSSIAFGAARDLIFKGAVEPSGYTEPTLHAARRVKKLTRLE
jgi:malate synthase